MAEDGAKNGNTVDRPLRDHGPYEVFDEQSGQMVRLQSPPVMQNRQEDAARRVARERALYEGGMPVAGHDAHRERER